MLNLFFQPQQLWSTARVLFMSSPDQPFLSPSLFTFTFIKMLNLFSFFSRSSCDPRQEFCLREARINHFSHLLHQAFLNSSDKVNHDHICFHFQFHLFNKVQALSLSLLFQKSYIDQYLFHFHLLEETFLRSFSFNFHFLHQYFPRQTMQS